MLFLSGRQIDFTVVNASETKNKITNYTLEKKKSKTYHKWLWQNNVKKYHNGLYVIVSFVTM